ncbi:MAG: hypothetical protein ACYSUB_20750 [Planctomycetota bacterium]|jgi:hypothetical protein
MNKRRQTIKKLTVITGIAIPSAWVTPVVQAVQLPPHAQASPVDINRTPQAPTGLKIED